MHWHQLDHMQTICTSLQTDNHTNTPSLNFYRPDALRDAQPTVSKHWRHKVNAKQIATIMVATGRIAVSQIDLSYSPVCISVHFFLLMHGSMGTRKFSIKRHLDRLNRFAGLVVTPNYPQTPRFAVLFVGQTPLYSWEDLDLRLKQWFLKPTRVQTPNDISVRPFFAEITVVTRQTENVSFSKTESLVPIFNFCCYELSRNYYVNAHIGLQVADIRLMSTLPALCIRD